MDTHVLLLRADLQSTLQLPIPCYTSTSHIIDNHYLSHHPLVPFLLYTTGTSRNGQRAGASREISDIATQSATQFQSPTLQAASGHSSSLHASLQAYPSTILPYSHRFYSRSHYAIRSLLLPKCAKRTAQEAPPPRTSAPPDPVAGACPRSPHTSLRRIFSSHPQLRFRQIFGLGANYIAVSRPLASKMNGYVRRLPHHAATLPPPRQATDHGTRTLTVP